MSTLITIVVAVFLVTALVRLVVRQLSDTHEIITYEGLARVTYASEARLWAGREGDRVWLAIGGGEEIDLTPVEALQLGRYLTEHAVDAQAWNKNESQDLTTS